MTKHNLMFFFTRKPNLAIAASPSSSYATKSSVESNHNLHGLSTKPQVQWVRIKNLYLTKLKFSHSFLTGICLDKNLY